MGHRTKIAEGQYLHGLDDAAEMLQTLVDASRFTFPIQEAGKQNIWNLFWLRNRNGFWQR